MDPVALGAVLLAVVTGASEALSGQLWTGLASLVRHSKRRTAASAGQPRASSGKTELVALQQLPNEQRAVALAEVLLARASVDSQFEDGLKEWWAQAKPVRTSIGNVSNKISGGTQQGPVLQGRDFTDLNFGAAATPAASPPEGPKTGLMANQW
jgi:hypothetical protein